MENENKIIDPLVADIFTNMFAQSEATTNAVFDNYERTIKEWKKNFLNLYMQGINASEANDIRILDRALDQMAWLADQAEPEAM